MVRFHGLFSPSSKLRSKILPRPNEQSQSNLEGAEDPHQRHTKMSWAKLLKRTFNIDVLRCWFERELRFPPVEEFEFVPARRPLALGPYQKFGTSKEEH